MKVIELNEQIEIIKQEKMLSNTITEVKNLKFLNNQKSMQIKKQNDVILALKKQLNDVLEEKATFNKESFEAVSRLKKSNLQQQNENENSIAPHVTDQLVQKVKLLEISEQQRVILSKEIQRYKELEQQWANVSNNYEIHLGNRENEIRRLQRIIEEERNWDRLDIEHQLNESQKEIDLLNERIDLLKINESNYQDEINSLKENGLSKEQYTLLNNRANIIEQLKNDINSLDQTLQAEKTSKAQLDLEYQSLKKIKILNY